MLKIRNLLIVLGMLLTAAPASAGIQVNIGINVPVYPDLVVVPGYPVYYAPQLQANLFFYDGLYWVYQDDYWYSSSWYNGPWYAIEPEIVPVYVLRIPVRYYRQPPSFFFGWRSDAPPRWGDHWGRDWEQHRSGWDRWNHEAVQRPAPLPVYQREYSGDRYPRQVEQQQELHQQKYRYEPRDPVVRKQYQEEVRTPPAQQERREAQDNKQQRGQEPREQAGQGKPAPQVEQRGPEERASGSMRQDSRGRDEQRAAPSERQADPRGNGRQSPQEMQQPGPREQQSQPPQRGRDEQRAAPSERQADPRGNGRQYPQEMQPSPREQQSQTQQRGREEQRAAPPERQADSRGNGRQSPQEMQQAQREQQMPKAQGNDADKMGRETTRDPQQKRAQEKQQKQDRNE